jgi:hypothetical protein
MARPKNSAETVTITISTTLVIKAYLEALVEDGLYGKNIAEAAERLLAEHIRILRGEGYLAERLAKVRLKQLTND